MKTCRQCGLENEEGAKFCGNCGEFLAWDRTAGDARQGTPASTPRTDPTTPPAVAGDLVQQARVATLYPDEKPPSQSNKPAAAVASARTVDIGVTACAAATGGAGAAAPGGAGAGSTGSSPAAHSLAFAQITPFPVATAANLQGIVAGPDGNLWFTESSSGKIARVTTSGTVTEFKVTTPGSSPTAITAGPANTLWFIDNGSHDLGRVTFS